MENIQRASTQLTQGTTEEHARVGSELGSSSPHIVNAAARATRTFQSSIGQITYNVVPGKGNVSSLRVPKQASSSEADTAKSTQSESNKDKMFQWNSFPTNRISNETIVKWAHASKYEDNTDENN